MSNAKAWCRCDRGAHRLAVPSRRVRVDPDPAAGSSGRWFCLEWILPLLRWQVRPAVARDVPWRRCPPLALRASASVAAATSGGGASPTVRDSAPRARPSRRSSRLARRHERLLRTELDRAQLSESESVAGRGARAGTARAAWRRTVGSSRVGSSKERHSGRTPAQ